MSFISRVITASLIVPMFAVGCEVLAAASRPAPIEPYIDEPLPPVVHVMGSENDGPLFVTTTGQPLYIWPVRAQNNIGLRGEREGQPTCGDTVMKTTAGFLAPYPPGLILPELGSRPSCSAVWHPFLTAADAKPVGKWSIAIRLDGKKQWAYDGQPVYTSYLDKEPAVPVGSSLLRYAEPSRRPIGPLLDIPAQFDVVTVPLGRLLTTIEGFSVYSSDRDGKNKSNCDSDCERTWAPVLAHASAPQARGEWGVIERSPGVLQWTFRKKPLYTLVGEDQRAALHGREGWHNVYSQNPPAYPESFTIQVSAGGKVLADAQGRSLYIYSCTDDALDQLSCDHPDDTQVYRFAICGGGNVERCLKTFPYVLAGKDETRPSKTWSIKYIDPHSGRYVAESHPGALRIWAFRDRPVYTFARDRNPGDTWADRWGEVNGSANGYHVFFVQEEFRKQFDFASMRRPDERQR